MHLTVTMTRCDKYCYHPTFCVFSQGYAFIDDLPWVSSGLVWANLRPGDNGLELAAVWKYTCHKAGNKQ